MTQTQKIIKYCAIAFAIFLIVSIFSGIVGVFSFVFDIFDDDGSVGEMQSYSVSEPIRDLEMEISAADLEIRIGESFSVESNLTRLKVETDGETLTVKDKSKRVDFRNQEPKIILTVPADFAFERVSIEAGAGRLTIDGLTANKLKLDLGAGETVIQNLCAPDEAEINGGAGNLTVSDGVLHDLKIAMGVGKLTLKARLQGDCSFDMGVGETALSLIGTKDDYRISVTKGLGTVKVDGESLSNEAVVGTGANRVEINGGVGVIDVRFEG